MTLEQASPLERLSDLDQHERDALIAEEGRKHNLSPSQMKATLMRSWRFRGRPKQQAPPGQWTFWFLKSGRGWGKTITAAEWTKERALERRCRIALVAPTLRDGRATMVEGETGMLSVIPAAALLGQSRVHAWNRTMGELTLANGTVLTVFSSEEPDRLRGPQHDYAWGEEVSSWKDAKHGDATDSTWSNLKLGLRLGINPQAVLTSTPKVNKLTKELVKLAETGALVMISGSSYENRENLADAWWRVVVAPLEGTRTGRQEIMAEVLEDVEGALWTKGQIELLRIDQESTGLDWRLHWIRQMRRIVIGLDPNTTSGEAADAAGIIVAGIRHADSMALVLEDRTVTRGGPYVWAQETADAYHEWQADRVIAEINNGGEMVEMVIKNVDRSVRVKTVTASRGKRTRAEPIAALYEGHPEWETNPAVNQPKVRHVGTFVELEDEQTTWTPEQESPNRMDALVWALTDLNPSKQTARRGSFLPTGEVPGFEERGDLGYTT